MIELVAEPGRTESRGVEMDSVHMAFGGSQGCQGLGNGPLFFFIYWLKDVVCGDYAAAQ